MINRLRLKELGKELTRPEINILLGPGQVGKTTLLRLPADKARSSGRNTAFFDLEQPQTSADFNQPDTALIEKLKNAERNGP